MMPDLLHLRWYKVQRIPDVPADPASLEFLSVGICIVMEAPAHSRNLVLLIDGTGQHADKGPKVRFDILLWLP